MLASGSSETVQRLNSRARRARDREREW